MRRQRKSALQPLLAALLLAGVFPGPADAQEEPAAAPAVPLDRLLQLPAGTGAGSEVEKRGGSTRSQWRTRYRTSRQDVVDAQKALDRSRAELEERMGGESSQWKMTPPGLPGATEGSDAPTDYRLSQEMRRNREELERAERQLQDLDVEANLAGVPPGWREDPAEPAR